MSRVIQIRPPRESEQPVAQMLESSDEVASITTIIRVAPMTLSIVLARQVTRSRRVHQIYGDFRILIPFCLMVPLITSCSMVPSVYCK